MRKFRVRRGTKRKPRSVIIESNDGPIWFLTSWRTLFYLFTLTYVFLVLSVAAYFYQRGFFSKSKLQGNNLPDVLPPLRKFDEFSNQVEQPKSPCFGSINIPLSNISERYFSIGKDNVKRIQGCFEKYDHSVDGNAVLHIPDWTDRVLKLSENNGNINKVVSKPVYFLSAVLRVRLYESDKARLTLAELKQWIHYQIWAGAEHIYICNHYLKDSERLEPGLRRYIDLGIVTVYPWNNITAVPGTIGFVHDNSKNQDGCYNFVLERHKLDTIWQYNLDMDEYPFIPSDQCEGFLKRYLFNLDHGYKKELISQVKLSNYLMKGAGDRTRDMTIDRINRIDRKESNPLVKPVYKLEFTERVGTHGVTTTLGHTIRPSSGEIFMLHYWGTRTQNWGPDTDKTLKETNVFNMVRETIAVNVRHSLLVLADFDGFNSTTGP